MAEQIFSGDRDVLPEGEPISPVQVGCIGCLAYKIGCLVILAALLFFIVVFGRLGIF